MFLSANDHKIAFLGAQEALEQARVLQLKLEEMLHDPKRVFAKRAQGKLKQDLRNKLKQNLHNKLKQNLEAMIPQVLKYGRKEPTEVFVDKASVSLAELAQGSKSKKEIEKDLQEACVDLLSFKKLLEPLVQALNTLQAAGRQSTGGMFGWKMPNQTPNQTPVQISKNFVKFLVTESFKLTDDNKMDMKQYCESYLMAAIQAGILPFNYLNYGDHNAIRGITDTAYQLWQSVLSVANKKSNK
ncbi:hypothetical protein [Helicobacter suis]|uniref:hypothetical protein n=1 Tax=Helicobacter suis TaxID=104628 RepID=UPI001F0855A1|nr:hypothetical protein [Helicobacter suis]